MDSKLLRTMGSLLFRPGRLTLVYIRGIHKNYYTPFKLFLFWLTIGFLFVNNLIQQSNEFKALEQYDFELAAYKSIAQKELKEQFTDSLDQATIDTILTKNFPKAEQDYYDDLITIFDTKFSFEDLHTYTVEELADREQITHPIQRLVFTQLFKAVKSPAKLQSYIISHLSWLFLFMLPLLAGWMYRLYWRKRPYYIQHFVYLLHTHTFALTMLTGMAFWLWINPSCAISLYTFGKILLTTSLVYSFWALKVVYQQGWGKTVLKYLFLSIGYVILFTIALLLFFLVNFLFF
ncbi:MAG: DUF3667 domain-containing protein [Aureispira sp.]